MNDKTKDPQTDEQCAPPATPAWITPERIAHTLTVWQRYTEERLTQEDAVAILISVGKLFDAIGLTGQPARGGRG